MAATVRGSLRRSGASSSRDLPLALPLVLLAAWGGGCSVSQAPTPEQVENLQRSAHASDVLAAAERGLSAFPDPSKEEHWRFRLAQVAALASLERFAERGRILQMTLPKEQKTTKAGVQFRLIQKPPDPKDWAIVAREESSLGWLELARKHRANAAVHTLYQNPRTGRLELEAALREALAEGDARVYAYAAGELGYYLANQFRLDEAFHLMLEAKRMADHNGEAVTMAYADANIGWLQQMTGKEEASIDSYTNAAAIFGKMGVFAEHRRALRNLGSIFFHRGDHAKAGEYFEQARKLIQPESGRDSVAGLWSDIAANASALGQIDVAEKAIQQATMSLARAQEIFEYPWILLTRGRIAEQRGVDPTPLYREAIAITGRDRTAPLEAYVRMARWLRSQGRAAEAERAYLDAVQAVARLRDSLQQDDSKIGFASTVNRIYQDYVDLLIESGREQEALTVADASRLQVFSEGRHREPLDLARLSALLGASRTTAAFYWLAEPRSYVWVIDSRGARLVRNLPSRARIEDWVRQYGRFIEAGRDPRQSDFEAPRKLWSELVEKTGVAAAGRVVIVPDGVLHWLNFETLPGTSPGSFWVEQSRVVVSPALRILHAEPAQHSRQASSPSAAALLVGDSTSASRDYPPLKHAGAELRSIAELFAPSARLLTGPEATPEAYAAANPSHFDVIHFAAHAEANARSPMDSAVILSPGQAGFRLLTRDVPKFPLRAGLVTLSACRGAGAQAFAGEGMVGFSWAYLRSGARQVVAGLWEADDESTLRFMRGFYQGMRRRHQVAPDALRAAKLDMIRNGGRYAKPYYWGPFQIFVASLE